jgi:DNA-binding beta-propeller fold protein YncE
VYVAGQDDVIAIFDRDPADGALTQKAPPLGCVAQTPPGTCVRGHALGFPWELAISPDGQNVYAAAAAGSSALTVFRRDIATGTLTQLARPRGCLAAVGMHSTCTSARELANVHSLTVSPDGRNVYAAAINSSALSTFDRR